MAKEPSEVTLRIRAYARAERLRAKIAASAEGERGRVAKHQARMTKLTDELAVAEQASKNDN